MSTIFKNRSEAGRQLAERLLLEEFDGSVLVLALPRGGVPVGFEVARALQAPLDVAVVRKIGLPDNPEYGIGAIAPGDVLALDSRTIESLGVAKEELDHVISEEMHEMERRMLHYKSGTWSDVPADTIIVVDDGLATGVSAGAALESVKLNYAPKTLVFAAPVCARDSLPQLASYTNAVICIITPEDMVGISAWYDEFPQVSDEEVLEYLEAARTAQTAGS